MSWVDALKEHAKKTGKFAVPKKGTPEYDAVKKIQDGMNAARTPEPAKEVVSTKKSAEIKVPVHKKVLKEAKAERAAKKVQDEYIAKEKSDAEAALVAAQKTKELLVAKAAAMAAEKESAVAKEKQSEEYIKANPTVRMRTPKKVPGPMRRQVAPPAVEFS